MTPADLRALWHPGPLDYVVICALLTLLSFVPDLAVWIVRLGQSKLTSDAAFVPPTHARQVVDLETYRRQQLDATVSLPSFLREIR